MRAPHIKRGVTGSTVLLILIAAATVYGTATSASTGCGDCSPPWSPLVQSTLSRRRALQQEPSLPATSTSTSAAAPISTSEALVGQDETPPSASPPAPSGGGPPGAGAPPGGYTSKPLSPMSGSDIAMLVVAGLVLVLAAGAGVGGGPVSWLSPHGAARTSQSNNVPRASSRQLRAHVLLWNAGG